MGIVDQARWGAYTNQVYPKGLDLGRCVIDQELGTYRANPNAAFRAGSIVTRENPTGLVNAATGADTLGVSKWNKGSAGITVIVDQAIVLNGTTPTNLTLGNLGGPVSNVAVRLAPDMGGALFTVATDYTVNAGNAQITRVALGGITDGQTVYVTFQVPLNARALQFDGQEFHMNGVDDVGNQDDFCTVIQGHSILFTVEWVPGTWALTGAAMNAYCSAGGQFSNTISGDFMGHCFQLPTSVDRWMGVRVGGVPVV